MVIGHAAAVELDINWKYLYISIRKSLDKVNGLKVFVIQFGELKPQMQILSSMKMTMVITTMMIISMTMITTLTMMMINRL